MAEQEQEPLEGMQAYRVKFGGLGALDGVGDTPPDIDDEVTYLVRTRCTAAGRKKMKDGELRTVRDMDVLSVEPQGPPSKPDDKPPKQPALIGLPGSGDEPDDDEAHFSDRDD